MHNSYSEAVIGNRIHNSQAPSNNAQTICTREDHACKKRREGDSSANSTENSAKVQNIGREYNICKMKYNNKIKYVAIASILLSV